jgi:hypothetical protein
MAIALGNNHWSQQHLANAVIHPITGKEMEYIFVFPSFVFPGIFPAIFAIICFC